MFQTTGIREVILHVKNMASMVRFYHETIGLPIKYPKNVRSYAHERIVTLDAGGCLLSLRAGGVQHHAHDSLRMVFEVRDIDAARCYLGQREVELGEIFGMSDGILTCDGTDPEGNPFALVCHEARIAVPI